jgi:hypothetical protein
MDRSFLSNSAVIAASRRFVCVRLATYESAAEAKLLSSIFVGRSGQLENTVFAILAPDGKTQLVRPGRSPAWAYRDAAEMSAGMKRIADRYDAKGAKGTLPTVKTVRLALNVAACDRLPLVVVYGSNSADVRAKSKALAVQAWGELIGRCVFASTWDSEALGAVSGNPGRGILVIQPGAYGSKGTLLATVEAEGPKLGERLAKALGKHRATSASSVRGHVRAGQRQGVHWETAIPVTDPGPPGRRR